MSRKHWTLRQPRHGAKLALVAILAPFLLVGCVSLDSMGEWFELASETCQIIEHVKKCINEM
jgi:hypothetical protein